MEKPERVASLAELWAAASGAKREHLMREYGASAIIAAITGSGSLRALQTPPPGNWTIWAMLAGRGFGKTHAGAVWIHQMAQTAGRRFALVGATLEAARAVMVEGDSGLLETVPLGEELLFTPSLRTLEWPNGSKARLYSGGDPDSLRGGQFHYAWGDEFAHWPHAEAALTNLRLATRLGRRPQMLLTTTPLPRDWLRALLLEQGVVVTRGRMRDNRSNLPDGFIAALESRYGGSAIGRQELDGEIITDLTGALWTRALIERQRCTATPAMRRVVVAVDPPAGGGVCGIIAAGLGDDDRAYVLEDASLGDVQPDGWARAVVATADRWQADKVVAEINQGGAMVAALLKSVDAGLPIDTVHASRGKVVRAEPVASLYGEERVFHTGVFPALEDQMCGLLINGRYAGPGASPDRADALVWAMTALLLGQRAGVPGVRVV